MASWLANGVEDPADEILDLLRGLHGALHDGEFVAAEAGDEIVLARASSQMSRDRLEELVADEMTERVVDTLELVDVDVMHRELLAAHDRGQLAPQVLVEHGAVGQVGQRVVMRQMGDARLDAAALGDVLVRGHPAAIGQRLVDDLDRAAVGGVDDHGVAELDVAQDTRGIFVDIAGEGAGFLAVRNDFAKAAARFDDVRRQPVHFQVALIADDEPLRVVEQ